MYHWSHICASLKIDLCNIKYDNFAFYICVSTTSAWPYLAQGSGTCFWIGETYEQNPDGRSNHDCYHLIKGHVCVFSRMNGEIDPLHTRLYSTFSTISFKTHRHVRLFLQNFSHAQCRLVSFYAILTLTPTQFKETLEHSWHFNRRVIPCSFSLIQLCAVGQKCATARSARSARPETTAEDVKGNVVEASELETLVVC